MKWAVVPVFAIAVAGCASYIMLRGAPVEQTDEPVMSLKGKPVPEIKLRTLNDAEVKLSAMKGSVVLVDVWATWCGPCQASLPHVQKLSTNKELAEKGLVVWAANMKEDKATIQDFMKQNKYSFTVLCDQMDLMGSSYFVTGIPTTFVIGRDGSVQDIFVGYGGDGSAQEIDAAVEKALGVPVTDKKAAPGKNMVAVPPRVHYATFVAAG